jgi:hypothetical protein
MVSKVQQGLPQFGSVKGVATKPKNVYFYIQIFCNACDYDRFFQIMVINY